VTKLWIFEKHMLGSKTKLFMDRVANKQEDFCIVDDIGQFVVLL